MHCNNFPESLSTRFRPFSKNILFFFNPIRIYLWLERSDYLYTCVFTVMDSLESIDKSYVIVPLDLSSTDASKLGNAPLNSSCTQQASGNLNPGSSAPVPNINAATVKIGCAGYMETQMSGPATSQGLMEITDSLEQPSTDCSRRVESLQQCASAITELVNEKVTHSCVYFVMLK